MGRDAGTRAELASAASGEAPAQGFPEAGAPGSQGIPTARPSGALGRRVGRGCPGVSPTGSSSDENRPPACLGGRRPTVPQAVSVFVTMTAVQPLPEPLGTPGHGQGPSFEDTELGPPYELPAAEDHAALL